MSKKIGIVTLYYKSINYGGNLQAYALCKALQRIGYQAEQICFLTETKGKETIKTRAKRVFFWGVRKAFKTIWHRIKSVIEARLAKVFGKQDQGLSEKTRMQYQARRKAFAHFNQQIIPHSETVYYADTISEAVDVYDCFITGSDQVWNFRWYHPIYFLDFVPKEKKKLSYAASIAMAQLNQKEKSVIQRSLKDYCAVSVREDDAIKMLNGLSPVMPRMVLDPTLLLSAQEWDEVCQEPKQQEKYVFCYYLGKNAQARKLTVEFAEKNGLKLIAALCPGEEPFGDECYYDMSPEEFLGYIKMAEYVFTDSFHATVFSHIYKKQFFVFNRNKEGKMNARIISLTDIFGTSDHFCAGEKESIVYLENVKRIDYAQDDQKFETLRSQSYDFLKNNLYNEG